MVGADISARTSDRGVRAVNGIYKNVSVLIGSDAIAEVTENGMRPVYPTGAETLNGIGLNA